MNIPIRRGAIIRHHNRLLLIEDFHERHTGQQKPVVHVRLKDLKDGHHVERTLDEIVPIKEVDYIYRTIQYTYARGRTLIFMDNETFDEYELDDQALHGFTPFLTQGLELRARFSEGQLVNVETPDHVSLHVAMTAAPERSVGGAGSVLKEAALENGLVVRVPLFIKTGDLIRVDTRDRSYAGKEKEAHA